MGMPSLSRATGMVMDLNRLMVVLREEIVSQVDHKHLNHDVPWLSDNIPTAENVAIAKQILAEKLDRQRDWMG